MLILIAAVAAGFLAVGALAMAIQVGHLSDALDAWLAAN
ncbi:hypothetical protein MBEBAB_0531 [Brevundimonas abyssalis TAR-001]|uniref:Uncharacterized protein n=1 Tax=Brevundimonas abyssalis TAR-001 TaxID=1391729 RepID=A0A8E0KHI3_9CAUL|nr:hypothetical protein MBEBAB_0531 [Brevundimonas abyssalis TAR-001]